MLQRRTMFCKKDRSQLHLLFIFANRSDLEGGTKLDFFNSSDQEGGKVFNFYQTFAVFEIFDK